MIQWRLEHCCPCSHANNESHRSVFFLVWTEWLDGLGVSDMTQPVVSPLMAQDNLPTVIFVFISIVNSVFSSSDSYIGVVFNFPALQTGLNWLVYVSVEKIPHATVIPTKRLIVSSCLDSGAHLFFAIIHVNALSVWIVRMDMSSLLAFWLICFGDESDLKLDSIMVVYESEFSNGSICPS
jgi:hypothetical protein